MSEEPHADPTRPGTKQLVRVAVFGTVAVVLWILAIVAVVLDEFVPLRAPLVNLLMVLALFASLFAAAIGVDYRRRVRGADGREEWAVELAHRDEADQRRHEELLGRIDAVNKTGDDTLTNLSGLMAQVRQLLEAQRGMVGEMERVAAATVERAQAATQELDQARWQLIAAQFREELGLPAANGAKTVVAFPHRGDPMSG